MTWAPSTWPSSLRERYEPLFELGGGGMGVVWAALDRERGEKVAIKTLLPNIHQQQRARRRFLREARAMLRLQHPHVARLLAFEEAEDGAAMILEYVDGETLHTYRGGGLSWTALRQIALQVADALTLAHSVGVIHRDLKPENILVSRDPWGQPLVKLVDFGIAQLREVDARRRAGRLTGGALLGTPAYMAPEQLFSSQEVGAGVDIYAMGVILFELTTGHSPFPARDLAGSLERKLLPPDPAWLDLPGVQAPRELRDIILTCLQIHPLGRYPFASHLYQALSKLPEDADVRLPGPVLPWDHQEDPTLELSLAERPVPEALSVGGYVSGPGGRHLFQEPTLVGREVERRLLRRAVQRTLERRQPDALLLTGAPGIGKSRLLHWLSSVLIFEGAMVPLVLDAAKPTWELGLTECLQEFLLCQPAGTDTQAAWLDALTSVLAPSADLRVRQDLDILVQPLAEGSAERPLQMQRLLALLRLLRAISLRCPLCLIVEGTPAEQGGHLYSLLRWLVTLRALEGAPLLVIATLPTSLSVDDTEGYNPRAPAAPRSIPTASPRGTWARDTAPEGVLTPQGLDDLEQPVHTLDLEPLRDAEMERLLASLGVAVESAPALLGCVQGLPRAAIEWAWVRSPSETTPPGCSLEALLHHTLALRIQRATLPSDRVAEVQELLEVIALGPPRVTPQLLQRVYAAYRPEVTLTRLQRLLWYALGEQLLVELGKDSETLEAPLELPHEGWRRALAARVTQRGDHMALHSAWERALEDPNGPYTWVLHRAQHLHALNEIDNALATRMEYLQTLLKHGRLRELGHRIEETEALLAADERTNVRGLSLRMGALLRAEEWMMTGQLERSQGHLERSLEGGLLEHEERLRAALLLADLALWRGRQREAARAVLTAHQAMQGPVETTLQLCFILARAETSRQVGRVRECAEELEFLEGLCVSPGQATLLARVRAARATTEGLLGRRAEAARLSRSAASLFGEANAELDAQRATLWHAFWSRPPDALGAALEEVDGVMHAMRLHHAVLYEQEASLMAALIVAGEGQHVEADALLRQVERWAVREDAGPFRHASLFLQAECWAHQGAHAEADALVLDQLEGLAQLDTLRPLVEVSLHRHQSLLALRNRERPAWVRAWRGKQGLVR